MKTSVVDTNVFLRYILEDDELLALKAERLFKKAQSGEISILVPQIVIFEIVFVLKTVYKKPKEEIIKVLKSLLHFSYIDIEDKNKFLLAVNIFKNSAVSFPDAFILATIKQHGDKLITFDKKLSNMAKSL